MPVNILEVKDFNDYYFSQSIDFFRFSCFLLAFVYGFTGILDHCMVPLSQGIVYTIRFAFVVPFFCVLRFISYIPGFKKYYQLASVLASLVSGGVIILIIAVSQRSEDGFLFYYNGVLLVLTGYAILMRMKVSLSILCGTLIIVGYVLMRLFVHDFISSAEDIDWLWVHLFFLIATFLLSNVANFFIQNYMKNEYANRLTIQQANKKLQMMDKMKSEFFINVSHELLTPLTLIKSPLDAFIAGKYGEALHRDDQKIKSIHNNTRRLQKMINNLLQINNFDKKLLHLERKKTDIAGLIRIFISMARETAESKNLTVRFTDELNKGRHIPFFAWIDKNLLETLFFNLLSNALKFTSSGGEIEIILDSDGSGSFDMTIRDTGIGIPANKLDAIFERFNRLNSSSSSGYEGMGIGLAHVKDVLDILEGTINVTSQVNRGSAFIVTLPVNKPEQEDTSLEIKSISEELSGSTDDYKVELRKEKPHDNSKKTILLVEDNCELLAILQEEFLRENYNVYCALNGRLALEKLTEIKKPDLIISDIMMDETDGFTFYEKLQENKQLSDIPFIFLTARCLKDDRIRGLKIGAVDFISKPFDMDILTAKAEAWIKHSEMKSHKMKKEINKKITELLFEEKEPSPPKKEDKLIRYSQMGLSRQKTKICNFVMNGLQNKEIAFKLNIEKKTVEKHLTEIYRKFNISNRIELFNLFYHN